jgi:hypothetical protein
MKKMKLLTLMICVITLCFNACKKDKTETTPPSTYKGKQILSFGIVTPAAAGVIDTVAKTITIAIPQGTSLTSLNTNIVLPGGVTISPASGQAQNFSSPVTYTVTLPDNSKSTWTVKVQMAAIVTISQDITQAITWTADKIYVVNGDIEITNNAVLTIEPGTVIKFNAGSSLSIGYSSNATIIANGTASLPITFTSSAALPAAGAWDGLYFYGYTLNNSVLKYCNVQYAGDNAVGAVNLYGCDLAIDYCNISNSGSSGIYTSYTAPKGGFVTFTNNTISNTVNYGIYIHAQKVSSIGTGNTITNTKGVFITGDYNNSTAQTWKNLNVPYVITSGIDIDGNLTIEAGSTFKFESSGSLSIGYYTSTTINMVGTAASPITFTSNASSPTAGAWEGITFYSKTLSTSNMSYCLVDYAGSSTSAGAVNLSGCSINYTYNIIRNCDSYGILLDGTAGFKSFSNNTISAANHLISISAIHVPDLGLNNVYTAATGKGIKLFGDANYASAVTWNKQSADFYITEVISLDGAITIQAGNNFKFDSNGAFEIGYYANSTFIATGTSTSPITFTSSSASPVAGSWTGLIFYGKTLSNTALTYCNINYSGSNSYYAIDVYASMSVNNCNINNCLNNTHPAAYRGTATLTGTGNNFTWFKI